MSEKNKQSIYCVVAKFISKDEYGNLHYAVNKADNNDAFQTLKKLKKNIDDYAEQNGLNIFNPVWITSNDVKQDRQSARFVLDKHLLDGTLIKPKIYHYYTTTFNLLSKVSNTGKKFMMIRAVRKPELFKTPDNDVADEVIVFG